MKEGSGRAALAEIGISARAADDLERILQLAQAERNARNSPQWKSAMEEALEAHGDAVEALHAELDRLLDERLNIGATIAKPPKASDIRKQVKKEIAAELKERLPKAVADILNDLAPSGAAP